MASLVNLICCEGLLETVFLDVVQLHPYSSKQRDFLFARRIIFIDCEEVGRGGSIFPSLNV